MISKIRIQKVTESIFISPNPTKNALFWENRVLNFPRRNIFYIFAGK